VQSVAVIGAALDLGQGRRGVDMGPSSIRYAGLADRLHALGREPIDLGNVHSEIAEAIEVQDANVRFLPEILATCERVAGLVHRALDEGQFPLVLGGDHSVALGSLGAVAAVNGPPGVLWLDAHGDLNRPETSPTGNVHGMVLAAALGLAGPGFESSEWPLPAADRTRVALVGTRSLDPAERELIRNEGIRVWTMSHLDQLGIERVMREALEHVSGENGVHVSLDMDVLDPREAPGVGTAVRGGLGYREAHLACELIADANVMRSLDVVEVNPVLDVTNETSQLAVELVASALGQKIL
jgi:arginase